MTGRFPRRADRWRHQLVHDHECALHPGVRNAQVLTTHETGDEGAAGRVREGLRGAEDEQCDQHHGDGDGPADDRGHEHRQHERATQVHRDDHSPSIESVGRHSAHDPEQQRRQVLAQQRHRHQEGVARLRGDEQRAGGDRDAVARVVDDRRREEPAEALSKPRRRDGLADPTGEDWHARQRSNPSRVRNGRRPWRGRVQNVMITLPLARPSST